jgi:hypothetical protein
VAQPLSAASPGNYDVQLAALGLHLRYLHDALRAGEQARRLVTANDPKNAGGTDDYFRRVRVLRDGLIAERAWARAELNGLPLVVNPARTIAIGVLLGDYTTGWVGHYHPRSRRPVGNGKIKLIAQNQQQPLFRMPLPPGEIDLEAEDLSKLQTWFLITYRRVNGGNVRVSSELSLPCHVDKPGYVDEYSHRIPLPELMFEGVIPYIENDDDGPEGYEVDVDER